MKVILNICRPFRKISAYARKYSTKASRIMEKLNFTNTAYKELPIDSEIGNNYRLISAASLCHVTPTPVENARMLAYSPSAFKLIGLTDAEWSHLDFIKYMRYIIHN